MMLNLPVEFMSLMLPFVHLRWVLVRDPEGKFDSQAFLSTNQAIAPLQILEWFVRRWQIEVTFQEVRAPQRC